MMRSTAARTRVSDALRTGAAARAGGFAGAAEATAGGVETAFLIPRPAACAPRLVVNKVRSSSLSTAKRAGRRVWLRFLAVLPKSHLMRESLPRYAALGHGRGT